MIFYQIPDWNIKTSKIWTDLEFLLQLEIKEVKIDACRIVFEA